MVANKSHVIDDQMRTLKEQVEDLETRLSTTTKATQKRLEGILSRLTALNQPEQSANYDDILERYELVTQENIELQSRLNEEAEIHSSFQELMTTRINEANATVVRLTAENERLTEELQSQPEELTFHMEPPRPRVPAVQAKPKPAVPTDDVVEQRLAEV